MNKIVTAIQTHTEDSEDVTASIAGLQRGLPPLTRHVLSCFSHSFQQALRAWKVKETFAEHVHPWPATM